MAVLRIVLKEGPHFTLCIPTWLITSPDYFSDLFAIFDDFSKWNTPNVLPNFEKSSNMAKKVTKNVTNQVIC